MNVAFIPAKDASAPSSPVAEERTATMTFAPSAAISRYAARMRSRTSAAIPAWSTVAFICSHMPVNRSWSETPAIAWRWAALSRSATPAPRIDAR